MKKITVYSLLVTLFINCFAQKIELENEYQFTSLKKDSYLGNVEYNPDDKTTSLYYVEKDLLKTTFTTYIFDENLDFVREESQSFNIIDAGKEAIAEVKALFSWFDYSGESYTKEWIDIAPGLGGELIARKQRVTFTFNWNFGIYTPTFERPQVVKIKGDDGERLYLYDYVVNTETGEAISLVGVKAEKGSKDKFLHARKFQLVKFTSDLVPIYLEEINFDYNMAISFKGLQYSDGYMPNDEVGVDDIFGGKLYLVFSPIKTMIGKNFTNPDAGKNTLIVIDETGKIDAKIDYTTKTTGWVIEDMIAAPNGDLFFYGPAKDEVYVNSVMPTNSPLTGLQEVKDIKWKNFQVMKISENTFQWISSTDLKEFKAKAVTPPSQRQTPIYNGKKFEKTMTFITPSGELFIGGQNYTTKRIPDPESNVEGATIKVIDQYMDLVLFHFDTEGHLKAQYGVRRDKMNKYSKAYLTPQDLYLSSNDKTLYWVYGEIKGMRRGLELTGGILELAGAGTISKRKLLYYPAVAKIDLEKGYLNDFVSVGADSEGKQKYYTNPSFPQLMSPDASNLTFIGEDKKGSLIWLGRMILE